MDATWVIIGCRISRPSSPDTHEVGNGSGSRSFVHLLVSANAAASSSSCQESLPGFLTDSRTLYIPSDFRRTTGRERPHSTDGTPLRPTISRSKEINSLISSPVHESIVP